MCKRYCVGVDVIVRSVYEYVYESGCKTYISLLRCHHHQHHHIIIILIINALFGITEQCANICVYVQKNEHMIACMYIYVKCVSRQFVENHHKYSVHERKLTQ
jgi:hypothetical protein